MALPPSDTGRLFDIQRYSVSDGPGIRTTVFFKGCSLRCSWCHNPEAISCKKQIMDKNGYQKEVGFDTSVEALVKVLLKDNPLYIKSGGGVTFSGGEPMLQAPFIKKVIPFLKKEQISIAIDTAGNVPFEFYESILDDVDLFLFDIKVLDPEKHRKYTGASNHLIFDNLEKLIHRNKSIELRLPVIKGINDSSQDIEHLIAFLTSLPELSNITQVKVLPYHAMGNFKYAQLGLKVEECEPPSESKVSLYRERIRNLLPVV